MDYYCYCYCDECEGRLVDTQYTCDLCGDNLEPCDNYPDCVAAVCFGCDDLNMHQCDRPLENGDIAI